MRHTRLFRAACAAALSLAFACAASAGETRRNFVLFVGDDLGWSDLGSYGSTFHHTPALDRLAAEGVRFTQAYSGASICSPTRASLWTGRHPVRTGVTDWIPGMKPPGDALLVTQRTATELAQAETTFGEVLRDAGYQTAYIGKWHLGGKTAGPASQGFTYVVPQAVEENEGGEEGRLAALYGSTASYTNSAIEFLKKRDRNKPFVLIVCFQDPHTPIQAQSDLVDAYKDAAARLPQPTPTTKERRAMTRLRQDDPAYASMVTNIDRNVGRFLDALARESLADSTAVIFTSDNGGLSTQRRPGPTANTPLRAGKGWLYEGGIRVPLIVRVPGVAKPRAVSDVPVVSMDVFPTLLELAGLPLQPSTHRDGRSLVAALRGDATPVHDTLHWHYPHYHGSQWAPGAAMRKGDWKLIEFFEEQRLELYNLRSDPYETKDLSAAEPAKLEELQADMEAWRVDTGAKVPRRRS